MELLWGDGVLQVPIPPGWRVLGPFLPRTQPPAADVETICRQALAQPLGAAPLATRNLHGKRVLLVADDRSRPTPIRHIFGCVRAALLKAGVAPENLEILFALGVHRPMTLAEAQAKIGKENLAAHRWHNHDWSNPAQLVHLGTTARGTPVVLNRLLTEFDLIVLLGVIEPHLLLGFSGGSKMLLPGCAGAQTIGLNHLQGSSDARFNCVGALPDESPMRLDIEEGVEMLGRDVFCVNAALNGDEEIVQLFCGEPRQVLRTGADFVRRHAEIVVPEQADVVITNSRPYDADLRQAMKCVGNTLYAARPGGLMLGLLRCQDGRGDLPLPSWTLPYPIVRLCARQLSRRWLLALFDWFRKHDPIEDRFIGHFGLQMLRRNHLWIFSDHLEPDTGKKLGVLRQYADLQFALDHAVRKFGPKASVAVFPLGGASYVAAPSAVSADGSLP